MKTLKYFFIGILCVGLTLLTQVGGVMLLLSISLHPLINRYVKSKLLGILIKSLSAIFLYLALSFTLVPVLAKRLGRVPLPIFSDKNIKTNNIATCLLNRHYVTPRLREVALTTARDLNRRFPGAQINYLDACFPFLDKFPLFPHLSHNDGKKLDLSFLYVNSYTTNPTNKTPSFIGYGICEEPLRHEENKPAFCKENGYWQYSLLKRLAPQNNKDDYYMDESRTRSLIELLARNPFVGKIFIEPHLKQRMKLTPEKIRFHGCQAVRHDDHIHFQLK